MSDTTSRFITENDEKETKIVYEMPSDWWSRHFEYIWAGHFTDKDDVVLDAACGLCHPFKFYLASKVREVFACDHDPRILSKEEILKDFETLFSKSVDSFDHSLLNKINFAQCDLGELPYSDKMFNKIFCISVFEHLPEDLQLIAMKEFARVLKDDGLIVLTVDHPDINAEKIMGFMKESKLKFYGDYNFDIPENAINTMYWGRQLRCIRFLICKDIL